MKAAEANAAVVVLVTLPTEEAAREMARALVEEELAACGNILPGVRSIYRWEGRVEEGSEALLLLKTRGDAFEALERRVVELHTYECPEVLRLDVAGGHGPYLDWISASVRDRP